MRPVADLDGWGLLPPSDAVRLSVLGGAGLLALGVLGAASGVVMLLWARRVREETSR